MHAKQWLDAFASKECYPQSSTIFEYQSILVHDNAMSLVPDDKQNNLRIRLYRKVNRSLPKSFMHDDGGWIYVYYNTLLQCDDVFDAGMLLGVYQNTLTPRALIDIIYASNIKIINHGVYQIMVPIIPPSILVMIFTYKDFSEKVSNALWFLHTHMIKNNRVFHERTIPSIQETIYKRIVIDKMLNSVICRLPPSPIVHKRLTKTVVVLKKHILLEELNNILFMLNNSKFYSRLRIYIIVRVVNLMNALKKI